MPLNEPQTVPPAPDGSDPEFGALLTSRRASGVLWILVLVAAAFTGGSLFLAGLGLQSWLASSGGPPLNPRLPKPPPSADWIVVLAGLGLAGLFGVLTSLVVREAITVTKFFELGVRTVSRGRARRSMAYSDCERFTFHAVRQYYHGVYAGTALTVTLKAKGRRTIKWYGRHKEKPKGLSITILGKGEFKGEDELDLVKIVIADAVADRWIEELTRGGRRAWGKALDLGAEDAVILAGKRRGQRAPYRAIDRFLFQKGRLHLFHQGDDKSCVALAMGSENFWPGMRVLERMWRLAAEDAAQDE